MAQSQLPRDPFAAYEQVMQKAQQVFERRGEERLKPLSEQAVARLSFERGDATEHIQADVLDVSSTGLRLAAFAKEQIQQGARCTITIPAAEPNQPRSATVRWVRSHTLIQVFGVQFD